MHVCQPLFPVCPSVRPSALSASVRPCPSTSVSVRLGIRVRLRVRQSPSASDSRLHGACLFVCWKRNRAANNNKRGQEQKHVTMCECSRAPRRMSNFSGKKGFFHFRRARRGPHCFGRRFRLALLCETCLRVFLKPFSAAFSPFMGFQWCL